MASAAPGRNSRREPPVLVQRFTARSETMGKGKMSGDDSAASKRGEARGSGGTTKKRLDPGKQSNSKADNTKSNRQ
jgi:hypothetical protein